MEDNATIRGFSAAKHGKAKSSNHYHSSPGSYAYRAWDHGWGCWQEKIFPLALEKRYDDFRTRIAIRQRFEKDRTLSLELERLLEIYLE